MVRGRFLCAGNLPISQDEWDKRAASKELEWLAPVGNTATKTPTRCRSCGHEWDVAPGSIQGGTGCPSCAGTMPLSQEEWDKRAARQGLEWLAPVPNNSTKTPIKCLSCGHKRDVAPSSINSGTGCPACGAGGGIKPDKPSRIYLIVLNGEYLKIGIYNTGTNRIENHKRNGWDVVQQWDVATGTVAREIELRTIRYWQGRGVEAVGRGVVPKAMGILRRSKSGALISQKRFALSTK